MLIGVISDTHGRYPPAVERIFAGVSLILHAGDVGDDDVIWQLEQIARVVAVRGNTDYDLDPLTFPATRRLTLEGVDILLCHEPWRGTGVSPTPRVVVYGHTHSADNTERDGVLWFNPGSPVKPKHSVHSVGLLRVEAGVVSGEIVEIA